MLLLAYIKPNKKKWQNLADVMLLLSIMTYRFLNLGSRHGMFDSPFHELSHKVTVLILVLIMLFPGVYGFSVLMWHVMPKCCVNRLRVMFTRGMHRELEESLPHCLQQNDECSPLV